MKQDLTTNASDLKTLMKKLEDFLELYLVTKAPFSLPSNWKEVIVKVAPWLTLIVIVLVLPFVLIALGLGSILAPIGFLIGAPLRTENTFVTIVTTLSLILEAFALPGLFKRSIKAWYLVYYATLLASLTNVISFSLGGLIIGTVLSLYVLFQVKALYK